MLQFQFREFLLVLLAELLLRGLQALRFFRAPDGLHDREFGLDPFLDLLVDLGARSRRSGTRLAGVFLLPLRLGFLQAFGLAGLPLLFAVGEDLEEFLLPLLLRGGHLLLDDHVHVQAAGVLDPGIEFLLQLRPHRLDAFGFGRLPAVLGIDQGADRFFLPLRLRGTHPFDDDALQIDGGDGARHILEQPVLLVAPFLAGGVELLLLRLLPPSLGVGDGIERLGLPTRLHGGDALADHLLHIDLGYAGHGLLQAALGVGLPFAAGGLETRSLSLFPFGFGLRQAVEGIALPLRLGGCQPLLDDGLDFICRRLGVPRTWLRSRPASSALPGPAGWPLPPARRPAPRPGGRLRRPATPCAPPPAFPQAGRGT